jgi:hypothetical protein
MPAPVQSWPEALVRTPAVAVIERAIEHRRPSHSLLLTGDDLAPVGVAHAVAANIPACNSSNTALSFPALIRGTTS